MSAVEHLPQPPSLDALCAAGALALFLDFDGTLVDIAEMPDAIIVPDGLGDSLSRLAQDLDGRLAIISGRAITNIESFTGPLAMARAGSHGADMLLPDGTPLADAPAAIPDDLRHEMAQFASRFGLHLEDKPHGAALHFRSNPDLEPIALEFVREQAQEHRMMVKRGKCVAELVNRGAEKGSAVRRFMEHGMFAGARPVFIGDDVTDEDGFAAVSAYGGFGILVGNREPSDAQYRLEDPAAVLAWLGIAQ